MRSRSVLIAAVAAVALPVAAVAAPGAHEGMSPVVSAALAGKNEVPKGAAAGSGLVVVHLDGAKHTVCWSFAKLSKLGEKPTAAHIHKGRSGKAGPVVVPFGAKFARQGCMTTTAAAVPFANEQTMSDEPETSRPREVPRENLGARRLGRAGFVGLVGAGVATLFYGKAISRVTRRVTNPVSDATGLTHIVPSSGWRIYTVADTMPSFDPATWRLRIDGLVERPVELSHAELLALPKARQVSTFHCVTGWVVKDVHWGGVRFHELLAQAKPLPQARAIRFVSSERPYDDYLDLSQVRLADVMLAYEMDGKALPREHGAPARLVIPDMYGYKNVKWVERIELVPRADLGYWEQRGYDVDAWVGRSNGA
jgi:DMSO/TMAO reductase YedYZ molybdopterin-dependent catalytic subunit